MVIISTPRIEREVEKVIVRKESPKEIKQRLRIEKIKERQHNAKSLLGYIKGCLAIAKTDNNEELAWVYQDLLNKQLELDKIKAQLNLNAIKGKSTLEILKRPDYIEIVKYQRPSPDEEPRQVITTISKEELNGMIISINNLCIQYKYIPSRALAEEYCRVMGIEYDEQGNHILKDKRFIWNNFFGFRTLHNKFTLILDALQEWKLIEYKKGKTKLLTTKLSIQTIFNL